MSFIRGNSKVIALLFFLLVPLITVGVTMQWNKDSNVTIMTDILTGQAVGAAGASASTLDSTSVFEWHKYFTIIVGPGHNDTSFFASAMPNAVRSDSLHQRIYLRGWSSGSRTQLVNVTPLWSYAKPFLGVQARRPPSYLWRTVLTDGTALYDSCVRNIIPTRDNFLLNLGTGTGREDSLLYYTGSEKFLLGANVYVPYAPYYDIVMADSAAATGRGAKVKITIVGYPE